jgi:hypothetical protein
MGTKGRGSYQWIDHYHMVYLTIPEPSETLQICRSAIKAHMAGDLPEPNLQEISASEFPRGLGHNIGAAHFLAPPVMITT